jgi:hypothetical protein
VHERAQRRIAAKPGLGLFIQRQFAQRIGSLVNQRLPLRRKCRPFLILHIVYLPRLAVLVHVKSF